MPQSPNSPAKIKRHRAQCQICRRADRKEIDRQFLDWTSPREIAEEYGLGSIRVVYRHAHALGLFEARRATLRLALDRLIEHVSEVKPTGPVILAAIRLAHQMDQQDALPQRNGRFGKPRFVLSLDGLPRTDAVFPNPPKTASAAPAAPEPKPEPEPASAPASTSSPAQTPPPAIAPEQPVPKPPSIVTLTDKQPTVRGFIRPWSKRKKHFASPASHWGLDPPGP